MRDLALRQELADRGIFFGHNAVLATDQQLARWGRDWRAAVNDNPHLAADAAQVLATVPNAGAPSLFTTIVDPKVIEALYTPIKAATVLGGEVQRGDWTSDLGYFPFAESTGQVASYNDYGANGEVGTNANWIPRQPYHWQAFKRYGEKQLARWGVAGIDYAARLDRALSLTFAKFANKIYLYGVSGLINYGWLNDPSLLNSISPGTKANTSNGVTWLSATALEIFNDFKALYAQLVSQMGGNVQMDDAMTLVISNTREPALSTINDFGVTVVDMIKKSYPNLTIQTVPEFTTGSGELMMLFLPEVEGDQTVIPAYTEKLRTHAMVTNASSWSQKVSAGAWGSIVRRPIAIARMLGI